jgi:glycosyltransferase involved in cell wall biosynthesis
MLTACTIIACNYLPFVRVLTDAFFAHHPDGRFTVLLIDDEEQRLVTPDARVDWRRLSDLGLDSRDVHRLAGIYDVTELATAVKPLFLRRLLEQGASSVIYLDPDICIYAPLDAAADLAAQHGVVLTPHTMHPVPQDGLQVDGLVILASGVYNLGFIAVGAGAGPFLEWWWQATRRHALVDLRQGLFTDQRWIDFVPCFFEPCIFKDPGWNVAYWNLHARTLTDEGDRYTVDGSALRFFHFSGFDPERPWLLSKNQGERPRILLSERPALARICGEYAQALQAAGVRSIKDTPYGWSTAACGLPMSTRLRRLYWSAVRAAEVDGAEEPPSPFDANHPEAFLDWLRAPAADGPTAVSRFLYSIYQERPDLRMEFPDLRGADARRFADWIWLDSDIKEQIPIDLLPPAPMPASPNPELQAAPLQPGINVVGYFRAELGIAEAARQLTNAIEAAGIPFATSTYTATLSRQAHAFDDRSGKGAAFDINLLCINADSTRQYAQAAGPGVFSGRYTIGFWFWELEQFPPSMHHAFDFVDEVWAATDFVAGAIRAVTQKPVVTIPLPVRIPERAPELTPERIRIRFGLPDRFLFLFMFDFLSIVERKNPLGLVEAFTKAFSPGEGPVLVVKTINGHLRLNELERLRAAVASRPDIVVIDGYYTGAEVDALVALCNCYVSLHRSEGLGLTLAEAMALGKPVIATGYSGNLHFMTAENSYLVDFQVGAVPDGCAPYPKGAVWADPDVDHAARLMREVYDRPELAANRSQRGAADIRARHTTAASASAIAARIGEIRRIREDSISRRETAPAAQPAIPQALPLETLLPHLEALVTPKISAGGTLSGLRLAAQRALFAVLRPYWFQQRHLQQQLIAALRHAAQAIRREQEVRTRLDARIRELTGALAANAREIRDLRASVDRDDQRDE